MHAKSINWQEPSVEPTAQNEQNLQECVRNAVCNYLKDIGETSDASLYHLLQMEVEKPLLEEVLQHLGGNQSKAAKILGLNRGTLRKKMSAHGLLYQD